jgi:hypothetical protein
MSEKGQPRLGGASCRSSHVRNAPLATVGPKNAGCRYGPKTDIAFIHSITLSARATSNGGSSIPRVFAVFRLMLNSNLVG